MRAITALEASRFRSTQENAMNDLCNLIYHSVSTDDYGDEVLTVSSTISGVDCGITIVTKTDSRVDEGSYTQIDYDAIVRLPFDTTISGITQIDLVDKQDLAINKTFKVTGFPEIGISALNIKVQEITE